MKNIVSIILLLSFLTSVSQSKKLWLKKGDDAFKMKDYPTAIDFYTKINDDTTILSELVFPYEVQLVNLKSKEFKPDTLKKHRKNVVNTTSKVNYLNHQLAECYRLNKDYVNAAKYYKIIVENKSYPNDAVLYAQSLINLKDYQGAVIKLEALLKSTSNDSLIKCIQKSISSCYFALDTSSFKKKILVYKLDTLVFNSGTSNFAPMFYGSPTKLLFTSARKGGVLLDPETQDSKYLCDIYYTEFIDSSWIKPINYGRPVNTGLHEGSSVVTSDNVMFFTRWSDANRNESFIYMAKMKDGMFFEAYKLSETVNKKGYKAMQPFVSYDGSKLFFSSNKPGGMGGFDLYVCNIDENGLTSEAKNLGFLINTNQDEVTPFFHTLSNTLFFSSNGHTGVGGLDIYKSSLNIEDSAYSVPKNLGKPINSSKDDAYFVLESLQSKGYFSSDREDCPGGNCYDIYAFDNEPILLDVDGNVYDESNNEPILGALITLSDVHSDSEPVYLSTNENGYYANNLNPNTDYFIKTQKKGYFAISASISTKGLTESASFKQDFYLSKIPEGDIIIEGIEYDLDKATLRPKSKEILNNLVELMRLNENISIEINSHTDTRGSDNHNLKLSQARAQSCVNYLIHRGIKSERMRPTGYGENEPLISDEQISLMVPESEEFEAAHQKNRRTAFKVIKEDPLKNLLKN